LCTSVLAEGTSGSDGISRDHQSCVVSPGATHPDNECDHNQPSLPPLMLSHTATHSAVKVTRKSRTNQSHRSRKCASKPPAAAQRQLSCYSNSDGDDAATGDVASVKTWKMKAPSLKCRYPGCSFVQRNGRTVDLRRHQTIHDIDRPRSVCPYCPKDFARGDALIRHLSNSRSCARHAPPRFAKLLNQSNWRRSSSTRSRASVWRANRQF